MDLNDYKSFMLIFMVTYQNICKKILTKKLVFFFLNVNLHWEFVKYMMIVFILLHVLICIALIFIVLIQTGKGGLDSNFGGVASGMLGVQGANDFVKRWTKILFAAFVISCVLLASQVKRTTRSGNLQNEQSSTQKEVEGLIDRTPLTEAEAPFDFSAEELPE